jgi:uncharacterized protein (UPF0147 family)
MKSASEVMQEIMNDSSVDPSIRIDAARFSHEMANQDKWDSERLAEPSLEEESEDIKALKKDVAELKTVLSSLLED